MPSAPFVIPPLLLIATLVVSAVAKLHDPADTARVFSQLRLPRRLVRLRVPQLLPYGELALAALLLLAPGRWYVVASTAALLLFSAYFLVILRALRLPYPVSCSCFGRLGLGEVTGTTLVRNGLLLALALVTWMDSWRGTGVAQRLDDLGAWAWGLVGVAAVALTVAIVVALKRRAAPAGPLDPTAYVPVPTPDGVLLGRAGPVDVRELTDVAARFLVFCDPGRHPGLVAQAQAWTTDLAPVRVHLVTEQDPGDDRLTDPDGAFRRRLGATSPGAVLLGTDRMLAGGPAAGTDEIADLVEAVATELAASRPST